MTVYSCNFYIWKFDIHVQGKVGKSLDFRSFSKAVNVFLKKIYIVFKVFPTSVYTLLPYSRELLYSLKQTIIRPAAEVPIYT